MNIPVSVTATAAATCTTTASVADKYHMDTPSLSQLHSKEEAEQQARTEQGGDNGFIGSGQKKNVLLLHEKTVLYDPTVRSCAWCYAMMDVPSSLATEVKEDKEKDEHEICAATKCPNCPRIYCTPMCCQLDTATHTFWCGKAGEKGVDFDVVDQGVKGLGLVTRRRFQRGEKILAERPILVTSSTTTAKDTAKVGDSSDSTSNASALQQLQQLADKLNIDEGMATHGNTTRQGSGDSTSSLPQQQHPDSPESHRHHHHHSQVNKNICTAAMALTPLSDHDKSDNPNKTFSLQDKISANGVSVARSPEEKAAGLFLTFSRVNHDCVGNTDHFFDYDHGGVQVLVANHEIAAGQEITFPYTRTGPQRIQDLQWRGFTCTCRACGDGNGGNDDDVDERNETKDDEKNDWGSKVNQLVELEQDINALNGRSQNKDRDQAVQSALRMLELYKELGVSDREFARTHYDLFQILVLREASLELAKQHIAKAHDHALVFCGYEHHETVQQFQYYRNHPESHGNYRAID